MNQARQFIVFFLILAVTVSTQGSALAQTDVQYFPETGHYVRGVFLQHYHAATDPALVYGYPLTEQIIARDGRTVQYFHKARFELSPNNTVQLTPLGELMYRPQNPLPVESPNGCRQYVTGYSVCLDFLKFYRANGEVNQFGYPISGFEYAPNGLLVQYFTGARFEWRTNLSTNDWIVITDLGRLYFDQQKEDPAHLRPVPQPGDTTIRSNITLRSRAFVLKAVTLKNDTQAIYVIVQGQQTSQGISDANVTALVHLADNETRNLAFTTNSAGVGQISFDFSDQKPGDLITIDITVNYQGFSTNTTTSFKVWF